MRHYILGIVAIVIATLSAFGGTSCVATPSNKECHQACNTCTGGTCSDNCIVCPATFYGIDCTRKCPAHCKEGRCEMLSNGRSVNCTMGCQAGYRGLTCNTRCKRPCLTCDRYTGRCTGPCRDGFYGRECSERCTYPCRRCDKGSGRCLHPCDNGFYGPNCSQRCSQACYRCHKVSGECRGHCNDGYDGETCTKIQLSDVQNRVNVTISITTEVQDEQASLHTTPDETNVSAEDENVTAIPKSLPTTKTYNPYIIAIVMVVVAAGLLVLITIPSLMCSWHRPKLQRRSVADGPQRDSDHVYDEVGPPSIQPTTVAAPDAEAGYLTPTRPNTGFRYLTPTMLDRDTGITPSDTGAGYLTAIEQNTTESRYLPSTESNMGTGGIVKAHADTESGYLTATQPNTETRYLTLSQSNKEARYLTLGQPYTDTRGIVKAPADAEAGYLTPVRPNTDTRYLTPTQPNTCPGYLSTFQPNSGTRKDNASKQNDCC